MGNLLIVGAGGHGKVVKEIAQAIGIYEKIDFVDDNSLEAIGKTEDLQELRKQYESAFVGIGDNNLRKVYFNILGEIGYAIPTLIHPTAYISKSAQISCGTVVEPKAIINAGVSIGMGGIVSVGAIVDHDVLIGDFVHVNAGAVCKAGSIVLAEMKIDAGQIFERK